MHVGKCTWRTSTVFAVYCVGLARAAMRAAHTQQRYGVDRSKQQSDILRSLTNVLDLSAWNFPHTQILINYSAWKPRWPDGMIGLGSLHCNIAKNRSPSAVRTLEHAEQWTAPARCEQALQEPSALDLLSTTPVNCLAAAWTMRRSLARG